MGLGLSAIPYLWEFSELFSFLTSQLFSCFMIAKGTEEEQSGDSLWTRRTEVQQKEYCQSFSYGYYVTEDEF